MSTCKLLSRIVMKAPDEISDKGSSTCSSGNIVQLMHDHTYGITSDPLTQFSCVFSALIHDVDHTGKRSFTIYRACSFITEASIGTNLCTTISTHSSGVPNARLIEENPALAKLYKNRSVAEQNSFELSWELLQDSRYADLRSAIYETEDELRRFRSLVVNMVRHHCWNTLLALSS